MLKLVLSFAVGLVGVALLHDGRPAPRQVPMARLQGMENRRFAELCRRNS